MPTTSRASRCGARPPTRSSSCSRRAPASKPGRGGGQVSRSAPASPGRSERLGAWGPFRGPQVRRPPMELKGQVAIVTGAGRGIGRATALEPARMGADIVVAELDRAGAERTAAEVKGLGGRASVVPTDVTSRADLAAMVERTRAEFGPIDVLVNNAGIYRAAAPL